MTKTDKQIIVELTKKIINFHKDGWSFKDDITLHQIDDAILAATAKTRAAIKQELKTLLKAVIKNNKDDFGTYDYDGIAQEIIALENSL